MRKIEFRGKCIIEKEFVYGDLIHGVSYKEGRTYLLPNKTNLAYVKHCHPLDGVEVFPDTIGQYTGENTKDGKPLYEGDILKAEYMKDGFLQDVYAKIVYDKTEFKFVSNIDIDNLYNYLLNAKYFDLNYEVVGNVYDNKDLVEL